MSEERYDNKLPVFNSGVQEDFSLWELRVQAALRGKELIEALFTDDVGKRTTDKAMPIIIASLGNNPLRTIQG